LSDQLLLLAASHFIYLPLPLFPTLEQRDEEGEGEGPGPSLKAHEPPA
jgi:hypothetical protein